jgi:two-component system response regulator FixJ
MTREPAADAKRSIIAIVDDDSAVRNSLAFAFQNDGFSVQLYESAEDLLRDPSRSAVDCFIVDYKLPGLNGLDLLTQLRRGRLLAPGILVTTAPSAEVRRRAAVEGATIVEKPFLGDVLFQGVYAALVARAGPAAE